MSRHRDTAPGLENVLGSIRAVAAVGTDVGARPEPDVVRAREPHDDVATEPAWLRRHWPLLALAAGAVAVALLSRYLIYPAFSWNRDEATYLWQVDGLRVGRIFTTDGNAPLFFWPWLTGLRDGGFFSQYTVGWPLVLLAFDEVLGSPVLALGARQRAHRARHLQLHSRADR